LWGDYSSPAGGHFSGFLAQAVGGLCVTPCSMKKRTASDRFRPALAAQASRSLINSGSKRTPTSSIGGSKPTDPFGRPRLLFIICLIIASDIKTFYA
jgi:hypothetical protein